MKATTAIHLSADGLILFLLLLQFFQVNVPEEHTPRTGFENAQRTLQATVKIETVWEDDGLTVFRKGTGAVISSDGLIVTNYHNIGKAQHIEVVHYDGFRELATMVASAPQKDLAFLRVESSNLPVVPLGNSESLSLGERVYAIGNPEDLDFTLTSGVVSAFDRQLDVIHHPRPIEQFIQTDVPINPGCSGGPLLNARGQLVGINTAIGGRPGHYVGYSFAQPVEMLKGIMEEDGFEVKPFDPGKNL